jgi:hypothetical protein
LAATKILHSQSLSFLKDGLNVFSYARHFPDGATWRNPGSTGKVIGNSPAGCEAGVIRDVEALPRGPKCNHFDMTVIAPRGATRTLSHLAVAKVNKHAPERRAMR